ncbi:MAG TPA: glycosyltransferase family 2 protein [Chthonomonadaceae bacterium]|nr:glycosyltransferase family 2 protein [Chthonomonadaceae bacterium]
MTAALSGFSLWSALHYLLTGGTLLAWLLGLGMLVQGRHHYKRLAEVSLPTAALQNLPRLSVLVPACNEAATVERAMLSLLALDYPALEIIAVDDRSTDATGAILDRLAAANPRLRVIHIRQLPPGWLGKNHALQVAGEHATGAWFLFTDADVVFAPDALRRAVAYACTHDIDHLAVAPHCETHGFWEKLFVSYFGLMFSFHVRPWDVPDPNKPAYAGFGAFNLVRAAAYRQFGGHRALPMEVADDMKLGKVIKRHGFRSAILEGGEEISVRWVIGFRGVLDSLTKNAFAGFEYRLGPMLASVAGLAVTGLYPAAALFLPPWPTRLLAAATLLAMLFGAGLMRRLSGASAWYGLAYPLATLIFISIILRSTWRAYRQNGIVWRGTLYPLEELKKGVV